MATFRSSHFFFESYGKMRVMKLVFALLLALTTLPGAAADREAEDEAAKQARIYQSRGESRPEGYVVGRSLLAYSTVLPREFLESLSALGLEDRWLDIGAGQGRAILDYHTSKYDVMLRGPRATGRKARATAMSIEDRRTPQWHEVASALGAKQIDYVHGKPLRLVSPEELSINEYGRFDVITDVFGGFSYTRTLSLFMEKALGLLDVDGTFYTVLQDVRAHDRESRPFYAGSPFLTELVDAAGGEMKVCAWLKSITCVEVVCEGKEATPPAEMYRVRKTCDAVGVPKLELIHFQAGTPPERRFRALP